MGEHRSVPQTCPPGAQQLLGDGLETLVITHRGYLHILGLQRHGATGALQLAAGAGEGLLTAHLAQGLARHEHVAQLAIQGLSAAPQRGQRDGVGRLCLLQLAQPRGGDSKTRGYTGGSDPQRLANGPQPSTDGPLWQRDQAVRPKGGIHLLEAKLSGIHRTRERSLSYSG